MELRDYLFLEATKSVCNTCLKIIDGKIIRKGDAIFVLKHCSSHGEQLGILEEDAEYHYRKRHYDKPGNIINADTKSHNGCPYDCGLCTEHEQHSCNALIDITSRCDLGCPICYASSGKGKDLDLATIEAMMGFFQEREDGEAEILQISGGEPTLHPDIFKILALAKEKKFKYVMLNTHGLRLARDEAFVKELGKFRGRFEIYLQFDGFKKETYRHFRGRENLLDLKLKAIENLRKYKIPITLVSTLEKGINDDEIGKIFEFAVNTPGIRGINFQPVTYVGRIKTIKALDRLTLSGVISRLSNQTKGAVKKTDIVPLPCNVERVAVSYFYRDAKGFFPLTRHLDVKSYLPLIDNTFAFDADRVLAKAKLPQFACCSPKLFLKNLHKLLPKNYASLGDEQKRSWWDMHSFRVSIVSFIDRYNFDLKSMKKECIHFITPDKKRIPFSSYNMIYRKGI